MNVKDLKLALGSLPDEMEVCICYRRMGRTMGSIELGEKKYKYFLTNAKDWFTFDKDENNSCVAIHS